MTFRCVITMCKKSPSLSLSIVVFYYFLSFFKLFQNKINLLKQRVCRDAFGKYPVLKNKQPFLSNDIIIRFSWNSAFYECCIIYIFQMLNNLMCYQGVILQTNGRDFLKKARTRTSKALIHNFAIELKARHNQMCFCTCLICLTSTSTSHGLISSLFNSNLIEKKFGP